MHRLSLPIVTLTAFVGALSAQAQPQQGDLVIGIYDGTARVLYAPTQFGAATTMTTWSGYLPDRMQVDYGNGAIQVGRGDWTLRVLPDGTATTLQTISRTNAGPSRAALTQDGHFLITRYTSSTATATLLKAAADGSSFTTLTTLGRAIFRGLCRNQATGRMTVLRGSNALVDVDTTTGALSTIATLPGRSSSYADLCFVTERDVYAALESGRSGTKDLVFVSQAGSVISRTPLPTSSTPTSVTYDDRRGVIYCGTADGTLFAVSAAGSVLGNRSYGTGSIYGLDIWDDRNISLNTTGVGGSNLTIDVNFPRSGGRSYCLAVSGATGPGIVIGGRRLNAALDSLLFATACALPGFAGALDSQGATRVTLRLPMAPAGVTVHVTGVAINPTLPAGIDVGNAECLLFR